MKEFFLTKIMVRVPLQLVMVVVVVTMVGRSWDAVEAYSGMAKEGCQDECGGVQIPYPFGIGDGCYRVINDTDYERDAYKITCDTNTINGPKPLLPSLGNKEVLSISLQDHSLRLSSGVAYECYNNTGESVPSSIPNVTYGSSGDKWGTILMSDSRNKFASVGCNTTASLKLASDAVDYREIARCTNSCTLVGFVTDSVCHSERGCCEEWISGNVTQPWVHVSGYSNRSLSDLEEDSPCGYAFVAEVGWYNFSVANLSASPTDCNSLRVPVFYNWFLDLSEHYGSCSEAKADGYDSVKTMCSSNSMFECVDLDVLPIFDYLQFLTCKCAEGYHGNPYLPHGCQDINECIEEKMVKCQKREYCVNTEGGYDCRCPAGHLGNGTTTSPCIHVPVPGESKLVLGLSIGMGLMIGFILLYGLYKLIKRRKEIKEKEHNFKRNGGLLLQQEMSTNEGAIDKTKVFGQIELEKATDNFNDNRILGSGGQGTVYKGMLVDGTIVAVKKSKKVDENQLDQFINEVVILSQINHRNIVKLFGCCLETNVPLLVYEFVPNGTLYQHIHHPSEDFHITWKVRFQIAIECAGAIAYLHSSCSSPIHHRDIKSSNILLDEKYKAKVSDFGTSRTISIDKTHVTTCVQGTFGYLDPEFFRSSQFSEKSDVYSFGVVLLELLTSKKPIFTNTFGEPRGLATEFIQMMETSPSQLHEILDTQVLQHCSEAEIDELAKLIEGCLNMNGKQRPTMKEVAMTLETIKSQQDKEGNLVAEQQIRGEERLVWIEGTSSTNEDPSINSSIFLPR